MTRPFSASADRNKNAILVAFTAEVNADHLVLEIGSGTGQHALHFAHQLPQIIWQASEIERNYPVLTSGIRGHTLSNVLDAIVLDVDSPSWPITHADICYTCNTLHIMSMNSVRSLVQGCADVLGDNGKLCVYGPFMINGDHISDSNEQFDQHLRASDPASGVRDLTDVDAIAQQFGFAPARRVVMPANNFFVVWARLPSS